MFGWLSESMMAIVCPAPVPAVDPKAIESTP